MTQIVGLFKTMRPHQWIKNGFIFVPLLFDRKLFVVSYLIDTIIGFILLCMASSAVYIVNDLADIEADRTHPTKRFRPLASGAVSKSVASALAVALVIILLPVAFWLQQSLGVIIVAYLLLQLGYTFRLKHIVLIDVMSLATGYVLRVVAGVVLVDVVRFSPWLYIFTTTLALFLGFAKRRQELMLVKNSNNTRAILKEYSVQLLDETIVIVSAIVLMTYALYTFSAEGLPENHAMMLTIPFVLYGTFRYLYLIHVKGEVSPPDEIALKDRPMQLSILLWVLSVLLVLYVFG